MNKFLIETKEERDLLIGELRKARRKGIINIVIGLVLFLGGLAATAGSNTLYYGATLVGIVEFIMGIVQAVRASNQLSTITSMYGDEGMPFRYGSQGYNPKPSPRTVIPRPAPKPAPAPTGNAAFCPQCGNRVNPTARFCTVCGAALNAAPAPQQPVVPPTPEVVP